MPHASIANRANALAQRAGRAGSPGARDAIVLVRWMGLALILALALVNPEPPGGGRPAWILVLIFAAYSLPIEVLARRHDAIRSRLQPVLDLALAGGLYLLSGQYDSPLYSLVFLVVVSATATLPPRQALVYVAMATCVVIGGELILRHPWAVEVMVRDVGGRLLRLSLVAIVAAILARRLTEQQLATSRARLEAERLAELERVRGGFVAAVSHDLRTPLTAVRAALGLLEASAADRLDGDELSLLTNARRNVDRLGLQINDLLSLSHLEADAFHIDATPLDLRAVIADAMAVAHPLIEQKGQVLQMMVDYPLLAEGDRRHLEQMLVNLVANAHRHTPPGTHIVIRGCAKPDGVLLQVEDDGPGMPPDVLTHIFDRFYQGDAAVAGSGLGLTIAKAIVERHGGRIWVESEPGHGTTVFVWLPCQVPKEGPCR